MKADPFVAELTKNADFSRRGNELAPVSRHSRPRKLRESSYSRRHFESIPANSRRLGSSVVTFLFLPLFRSPSLFLPSFPSPFPSLPQPASSVLCYPAERQNNSHGRENAKSIIFFLCSFPSLPSPPPARQHASFSMNKTIKNLRAGLYAAAGIISGGGEERRAGAPLNK